MSVDMHGSWLWRGNSSDFNETLFWHNTCPHWLPTFLSTCLLFLTVKVRLLDGTTISTVFKALEPLAAVRVYVQMNSNTPEGQDFTLLSPYPRHVYTELDMEKPLKELGEHWTENYIWIWSNIIYILQHILCVYRLCGLLNHLLIFHSLFLGLVPSAVLVVTKKWNQENLLCEPVSPLSYINTRNIRKTEPGTEPLPFSITQQASQLAELRQTDAAQGWSQIAFNQEVFEKWRWRFA